MPNVALEVERGDVIGHRGAPYVGVVVEMVRTLATCLLVCGLGAGNLPSVESPPWRLPLPSSYRGFPMLGDDKWKEIASLVLAEVFASGPIGAELATRIAEASGPLEVTITVASSDVAVHLMGDIR